MPLKYWRTILIASALGVCGLAVWASDTTPTEKPAAPMPAPPPVPLPETKNAEPLPRTTAADPSPDKEPPKVLDLAGPPPSLPVAPPVVPPPVLPTKAEDAPPKLDLPTKPTPAPPSFDPPPAPKSPSPPPLSDPPPLPKGALDLPDFGPKRVVLPAGKPKNADLAERKLGEPGEFLIPGAETTPKPPPPVDRPKPVTAEETKPAAAANGSYKLHVRMGGNLGPRFEVRDGDALLLKVYCEHIEMQGQHG